jgi:hypothetical protein
LVSPTKYNIDNRTRCASVHNSRVVCFTSFLFGEAPCGEGAGAIHKASESDAVVVETGRSCLQHPGSGLLTPNARPVQVVSSEVLTEWQI